MVWDYASNCSHLQLFLWVILVGRDALVQMGTPRGLDGGLPIETKHQSLTPGTFSQCESLLETTTSHVVELSNF